MEECRIAAIQRWPVKGLGPDPLNEVELSPGRALPFDRAWAIENGPSGFDPQNPRAMAKTRFLMLMKNGRLAALDTRFDEAAQELTIFRHGKRVAGGRLGDPVGRSIIEQFFAAFMADELRGSAKLLWANDHTFSDTGLPVVSIINLESIRELERVAGRTIDPLRFRANLHVNGLDPWAESDLVGRHISLAGGATLRVIESTTRCAATNVDPATGIRDMQIPRLIESAYGHCEFGVYAEVARGGTVRTGDPVSVHDAGWPKRERLPF